MDLFSVGDLAIWSDLASTNEDSKHSVPRIETVWSNGQERGGLSFREYMNRYFYPPPFEVIGIVEVPERELCSVGHTQRVRVLIREKRTGEKKPEWMSGKWLRNTYSPSGPMR